MRRGLTHDFEAEPVGLFQQESRACLAIVDPDSYPAFVSTEADHLDLLRHLCAQTEALTAALWEVPDIPLRLKLVLARDHWPGEELTRSGHYVVATGRVRSFGRLCLAGQEWLLDCARGPKRGLLRRSRIAESRRPRLLLVPSGVYEVLVYSGSVPLRHGGPPRDPDALHYVVVLRHYPHPAPRLQPVRLGSLIPWAGVEAPVNARPFGL